MKTIFGIRIIENDLLAPERPRLQIRPDVPCSDNVRAELNAWLADTFGYEPNIVVVAGAGYVMHPAVATRLKVLLRGSSYE